MPITLHGLTKCLPLVLAALLTACGGGDGGGGGGNATGGAPVISPGNPAGASLAVDASPLRATLTVDTARAVTQTVAPAGGTLAATGADGTLYTLSIPADALLQATDITMTPLTSLSVAGLATSAGYGVQLSPEGQSFINFVTLTITPPAGASVPIDRQIPIGWSGADNTVSLASIDPASRDVKLKLLHFSGYALLLATTGTNATLEPARHRFGGDAEARLQSQTAERLLQERQRQLQGQATEPLSLDDLFKEYDEQVVKPRVAAAGSSCAAGRLAIQTVLGVARQRALMGYADDGSAQSALTGSLMGVVANVCTQEEYALCRDHHIITRMLPYYLGLLRQSQLTGATADGQAEPVWLQDAEAATSKCLNFEMQIDSRVNLSTGSDVSAHTMAESVTARLPLPFNLGAGVFGGGGAALYVATSPDEATLASTAYNVAYPHHCAAVSGVQPVDAGLRGSLGFIAESGGVAQRALVKDFYFTPAAVPRGLGSQYTLTTRSPNSQGGCDGPPTTGPVPENWLINGYTTWPDAFADPTFGMAVRGWTIVGGDIMATRDFTTTASDGGNGQTTVTTHLVLFHKPAP